MVRSQTAAAIGNNLGWGVSAAGDGIISITQALLICQKRSILGRAHTVVRISIILS